MTKREREKIENNIRELEVMKLVIEARMARLALWEEIELWDNRMREFYRIISSY